MARTLDHMFFSLTFPPSHQHSHTSPNHLPFNNVSDHTTFSEQPTSSNPAYTAQDANDMERWTHQQEKLLAGVATGDSPRSRNNAVTGSSNTKKRKVPSLAHPSDTSASMSRKPSRTGKASVSPPVSGGSVVSGTSGQADPLGPWLARSALNNGQPGSAEFNRSKGRVACQAADGLTHQHHRHYYSSPSH